MMSGMRLTGTILGGAALVLALSSCAGGPAPGVLQASGGNRVLELGRNAAGDNCTAAQNWTDPALGDFVKNPDVYSVNCSGAVTGTLARVRLFDSPAAREAASAGLSCGKESDVPLTGFDRASARRCFDAALGFATVVIDADRRGTAVQISAAPNAMGAG